MEALPDKAPVPIDDWTNRHVKIAMRQQMSF
jgi:hypothetical protein